MIKVGLVLFGLLFTSYVNARAFKPILQIGYDLGGDSLRTATDQSNFDLKAGSGFYLAGGTLVEFSETSPHAFEAQLTLSYKFSWDSNKDNGDVSWRHFPIEFMYFYRNKRYSFRMGYGASYYTSSELEKKDGRSTIGRNYKNKIGYILAVEKTVENPSEQGLISSYGARYNFRDFTPEDGGPEKSGNAFGLYLTFAYNDI